ncbi:MAG: hypothetical protein ACRDFS_10910 [Chloroflexota bacterium]
MARTDSIWHVNSSSPRASFPKNICRPTAALGENVGEAGEGNTQFDLESLNSMMMSEPHSRSGCAHTVNHACNLLSPLFRRVGIGIDRAHGDTWLTEDFTG